MKFIVIDKKNIDEEHICCAISDKKCEEGYRLKKQWLKKQFDEGYVFRRLDARAKVFIEYGPANRAWLPVRAKNMMMINCLWVSGQYKGHGYARQLLQFAIDDALALGMDGLVTVVGTKKFHFMSDTKWLLKQGFVDCQQTESGFSLLVKKWRADAENPTFNASAISGSCEPKTGIVVYYSDRCPFTEYHIRHSLQETATKRNLPLKVFKIETIEEAQSAPSPATIFSLFYNGKFVTTNISACLDSKFDKIVLKK